MRARVTLSVFVLMFICLNVGGALCLSYCSQLFSVPVASADDAHLSDHCKQAKKAAEQLERETTKLKAGVDSCCMMPVAMFAAPVEKRAEFTVTTSAVAPTVYLYEFIAPVIVSGNSPSIPVYRPPPLDRRGERILQSVFRI